MLDLYLRGVLWVQQIFVPAEAARWERLLWRRRVGVEPTIRSAKERIAGFEGRESHRTLFASGPSIAELWAKCRRDVALRYCEWLREVVSAYF